MRLRILLVRCGKACGRMTDWTSNWNGWSWLVIPLTAWAMNYFTDAEINRYPKDVKNAPKAHTPFSKAS